LGWLGNFQSESSSRMLDQIRKISPALILLFIRLIGFFFGLSPRREDTRGSGRAFGALAWPARIGDKHVVALGAFHKPHSRILIFFRHFWTPLLWEFIRDFY
jgi:hypothetical protein